MRRPSPLVAFALLLAAGPVAAEIYSWVDEQGVTHVVDDPAAHQVDDQRRQAHLEHVRAERDRDRTIGGLGGDDARDELLEVLARVDVGQRVDERGEPGERRRHRAEMRTG